MARYKLKFLVFGILLIVNSFQVTGVFSASFGKDFVKPDFIAADENLVWVYKNKVYLTEISDIYKVIIEKLYFVNDGKLVSVFSVFPDKFDSGNSYIEEFDDVLVLYRRYSNNKRSIADVAFFDYLGNVLTKLKWSNYCKYFFNTGKNTIVSFDKNAGTINILDLKGHTLSSRSVFQKRKLNIKNDFGDEVPEVSIVKSGRNNIFLVVRTLYDPKLINEYYLVNGNGNIIYKKSTRVLNLTPKVIDDENKVFVIEERLAGIQGRPSPGEYVCYDFKGNEKWRLDARKYFIRNESPKNGYLKAERKEESRKNNRLYQLLNVTTGKISAE